MGVYSDRQKKRGLRHGSGSTKGGSYARLRLNKRGVLGMGQVKKGVFTVAHTCTGHICECPPPPRDSNVVRDEPALGGVICIVFKFLWIVFKV